MIITVEHPDFYSLESFEGEEWRDVPNYKGAYKCSNFGRVKSIDRVLKYKNGISRTHKGVILKQNDDQYGYLQVGIHLNGKMETKRVHQLVAESFLEHTPRGHKVVVNHIDYNKYNNNLHNLELTTQRKNANLKRFKSTSKYVGVHWNKRAKKWRSQIRVKNKLIDLGYFNDEYDAHLAYQNKLNEINNEVSN